MRFLAGTRRALRRLSDRPSFVAAPGLVAGALVASALDAGESSALFFLAAAAAAAACSAALRRSVALAPLALASLLLGAGSAARRRAEPSGALRVALSLEGSLVEAIGRVRDTPFRTREGTSAFSLEVEAVLSDEGPVAGGGRLLCRIPEGRPALLRGDRVAVLGRLRLPRPATNPGETDAAGSLRRRGTVAFLETRQGAIRLLEKGPSWHPLRLVDRFRRALERRATAVFRARNADLAFPLLLGLRERTDPGFLALHARTGLLHYLAISGVHALFVAGGARALLRRLRAPPRTEAASLVVLVGLYAALTGFAPPVVRAATLLAVHFAAPLFRRASDPKNSLFVAACVGALLGPTEIASASFQLSHAAAFAIAFFARPVQARLPGAAPETRDPFERRSRRALRRLVSSLRSAVAVSLAASLATAPLIYLHFGTIAPWSAPLSVLFGPLVAFLLASGYAALLLPDPLGSASAFLFDRAAATEVALLRLADALPATPLDVPPFSPFLLAAACAATLIALASRPAWPWLSLALVALGCATASVRATRALRLAVLDVGHGLATVLVLPSGEAVLFDAGSSERRFVGARVVLPYLVDRRVASVLGVVLSHAHADHWNGLPDVLATKPPRWFLCREGERPAALRAPRSTRLLELREGVLAWREGEVLFEAIAPPLPPDAPENARSLALAVTYGGRTALLCGDPEGLGLVALARILGERRVDLLLVPHHALPDEALPDFLRRLRPRLALASAGRRLDPAEGLRELRKRRIPFLLTRDDGAIEVVVGADGSVATTAFRRSR